MIKIFLIVIFMFNLLYATIDSKDNTKVLQEKFIESFQLCLSFDGEYERINKFAVRNLKLKDVSDKIGDLMLAPVSTESKTFLLKGYKKDHDVLILTTQNPDNCTVTYSSDVDSKVDAMENIFINTFNLFTVNKEKKGLQSIATYILDGKNKSKKEMQEKGLVHLSKYQFNKNNVFAASFSPPSSIKQLVPQNEYYECKDYPSKLWFYIVNKVETMDLVVPINSQYDIKYFIKQGNKYCNKLSLDYCISLDNSRITFINPYQKPISILCTKMTEEEYLKIE